MRDPWGLLWNPRKCLRLFGFADSIRRRTPAVSLRASRIRVRLKQGSLPSKQPPTATLGTSEPSAPVVNQSVHPPRSLRIALIVDPFTLRMKGGDHAPVLSAELLGRGHQVRGFGAPPGVIPRSRMDSLGKDGLGVLAFRPDVVLAYDALSPAGWHGMRCARRLGVPLVAVEEGFSSRGSFIERRLRGFGETLWGRAVRKVTARVLALDHYAQSEAIRRGFDADIVEVVPRGLDLEHFRPGLTSRLPERHGATGLSLLYQSPIEEGYHIGTLLQAFAATVGQREDWALLLASDGDMRSAYLAHASRLGIGSRVHWLGRVRKEELPGLMSAATLMVAPGGDRVVDGIKVRRAMACGLPVLAADLPRFEGAVVHQQNGLVLPAGDVAAWSEGIRLAAGSPKRREAWRHRAREMAEEQLAWSSIGAQVESLLLTCVNEREAQAQADAEGGQAKSGQDGGPELVQNG